MAFDWGKRVIAIAVVLHMAYFLVEICLSVWTNSVALQADSYRILTDGLALTVGLVTMLVGEDRSDRNTYGWDRIYVLGGFISCTLTFALFFTVATSAIQRLVEIEELNDPFLIIMMGTVGLSLNILCLVLFGSQSYAHVLREKKLRRKVDDDRLEIYSLCSQDDYENDDEEAKELNSNENKQDEKKTKNPRRRNISMCFVALHVIGSNFGSVTLIISGVLTLYGEGQWCHYADPLLTIVMVAIIIISDIPLLHRSAHIMLQTVPQNSEAEKLKENIKKQIPEVTNIHELHIWQLTDDTIVTTLHYVAAPEHCLSVFRKIKQFLKKAGIQHVTIQPEISCGDKADENANDCLLCSVCINSDCSKLACCDQLQKTVDQLSTNMEICIHSPRDGATGQAHHHTHRHYHHHHHHQQQQQQHRPSPLTGVEEAVPLGLMGDTEDFVEVSLMENEEFRKHRNEEKDVYLGWGDR